jgi:hypothetical protein
MKSSKKTTSHKISICREILRNYEIKIIQCIFNFNGIAKKSDIINHLRNDLEEEDIDYHLTRLEKLKVVQIQRKKGVSEAHCCIHPEADDFVRAFLALLFR